VQIYTREAVFLDSLEGFVSGGLLAGEAVIVIATAHHRQELQDRLARRGIFLVEPRAQSRYIDLDADETLALFMVDGLPDAGRFSSVVSDLMTRARGADRKVRAFGEMVAILWARGNEIATFELEKLWHGECEARGFSLFCAYPRNGFSRDGDAAIERICSSHSQSLLA